MRGKKARAIRRVVYGSVVAKVPKLKEVDARRYYTTQTNPTTWFNHPDSLRRQYQRAKAVS
jgi:hypothetical protein